MLQDQITSDTGRRTKTNRVPRACDRCRIRKIKCNGKSHCNRCAQDDAVCVYTKRRRCNDRAYSKEYVQLLEEQQILLIRGVKELYRRSRSGLEIPDLPSNSLDNTSIHEILTSLDILGSDPNESDQDQASTADDVSTTSSNCEPTTQVSFTEDFEVPNLTNSLQSSPSAPSPPIPLENDVGTNFYQFPQIQLQSPPVVFANPTPKSAEYSFEEAFHDICMYGTGMDVKYELQGFVNPVHTSYTMPLSLQNIYIPPNQP